MTFETTYLTFLIIVRTFLLWTEVMLCDERGKLLKAKKLEQLYSSAPDLLKAALSTWLVLYGFFER